MKKVLNHFAIGFAALAMACALGGCLSSSKDNSIVSNDPLPPHTSNSAPTISGNPSSSALIDEQYSFTPSASDADPNDVLTFAVSGEPDWLTIDSGNGALTGTPLLEHVGPHSGIVVSVSDGSLSASLPQFTVDVVQNADGSITLSWTPPTLNEDGSDVELAAYKFYYGTSPGSYSNQVRVDSPGTAMYVLGNLTPATYYVVATAIGTNGAESAFSNEASKQVL